jgi:hypothetical protein
MEISVRNFMPILFVGYDRPKLTSAVLTQFLEIPATNIYFSIDKSNPGDHNYVRHQEVLRLLNSFKKDSHHKCEIFLQEENVGCNKNTLQGMDFLLSSEPYGLLIEDDCEFRIEYYDFLVKNYDKIDSSKIFSVTPMNLNWKKDLTFSGGASINWSVSNLMGASLGMTFSQESKRDFDHALTKMGSSAMAEKIKNNAKNFPLNFLQREVIKCFFEAKSFAISYNWDVRRAEHSNQSETGWDSAWQLAAFYYDKEFLLPSFTLARENLDQSEGQWHTHKFSYPSWSSLVGKITIDDLSRDLVARQGWVGAIDKWGIGRFPARAFLRAKRSARATAN